jgi:hypothetical protein
MMTAATMHPGSAERTSDVRSGSEPEFAGLTSEECAIDCCLEHCVISGKPYCAHPRKCGLLAADKVNSETMKRFNRARKMLAMADAQRATYE